MEKQTPTPTTGSIKIQSGFYSEPWQRSASILFFQVETEFLMYKYVNMLIFFFVEIFSFAVLCFILLPPWFVPSHCKNQPGPHQDLDFFLSPLC